MTWQPIESAPKDGTWIAAICDDFEHPVICKFERFTQHTGNVVEYWELSYASDYEEYTCTPTQWCELPKMEQTK